MTTPKVRGISPNTFERLIIDSGAIYKNFVDKSHLGTFVGATRGGNVFKVETEIRTMPIDGALGAVKGADRITGVVATINANFLEITKELLALSQPGADIDAIGSTHNKISRDRDIANSDYISSLAIVGNVSGSGEPVICVIKNALSDGKLDVSFVDKEEGAPTVTFMAHFSVDDLLTEPWEIHWPICSSSSSSTSSSASSSASAS
jgi:hypothetical protein